MKKMLALLAVLCSATAAFAQNDAVVRWKTIVGNITVSNNDAVGGIIPGTTPWSTVGGRARVNLATGPQAMPRQRPHFAAITTATGIQVSVILTYDDATPFAGTVTITDDSNVYRSVVRGSVPVEVVAADFDATGKAVATLTPDPAAIYSAHLYDATGIEIIGPLPILTMFFDLSQISSFTLTGTIRKTDNALIQPYSLSAP